MKRRKEQIVFVYDHCRALGLPRRYLYMYPPPLHPSLSSPFCGVAVATA